MAPDGKAFPQFADLPKEIQILIWEAAVRPVPGDRHVHRLSIAGFLLRHTNRKHLQLQRTENLADGSSRSFSCTSLTIPTDDVDGNPNDSVYLSDSALWTICKESRSAMQKRFTKNEWWSNIKSSYHPKRTAEPGRYLYQEDATHTASYKDQDGVVHHITIGHEKDLIHLGPRYLCNIENIDWFHLSNDIFHLPAFDRRSTADSVVKPSFLGENIALDYDQSIYDKYMTKEMHYREKGLEMPSVHFLDMCMFLTSTAKRTIWFIDYGLIPAQSVAETNDTGLHDPLNGGEDVAVREVFRSGDCIYTEVKREDIGPLWRVSDYDKAYDGDDHHVFEMFSIFQGPWEMEDPSKLRVLACQAAPGRPDRPRKPWTIRCHGHPTCEVCNAKKPVPRVRPSTIKDGTESSDDISESDLNLFG